MKLSTALLGATAAGGVVYARRRRDELRARPVRHAVTVLAPAEQVRSAWDRAGLAVLGAAPPDGDAPRQLPDHPEVQVTVALVAAPDARGTEIRARAEGASAGAVSGPLREDLRRLKALVECGESVTVQGQPAGRGPAQQAVQQKVNQVLRRGGMG